ncbi:MAG: hypothetical protein ACKOXB_09445 [Flavobacteriales bacterium]
MSRLFLYFILIAFAFSCATGRLGSKTYKPANADFAAEGIVFVSFQFKKKDHGVDVSYVESISSSGTLKVPNAYEKNPDAKYLIQLQDEKGKPLADCYIEDPLEEHKDVFSENGKIEKAIVKFDEKILTIRLQKLSKNIAKAVVFEITTNQYKYITNLNCQ